MGLMELPPPVSLAPSAHRSTCLPQAIASLGGGGCRGQSLAHLRPIAEASG